MSIQRLSNAGQSGYRYKTLIAGITPVASVPTIGTATALTYSTASVTFTAPGAYAGATYTATSSPGGFTGTSASSPITVSGLSEQTAYTFTVTATNASGTSSPSAASNSITTPAAWSPEGAYDSLASVTAPSGGVASIVFSGIPAGYKHLQIRANAKTNRSDNQDVVTIRYNGDTSSTYAYHILGGNGTSAFADAGTSTATPWAAIIAGNTSTTNMFGAMVSDVLDYSSTSKYKTIRTFSGTDQNSTAGRLYFDSTLWQSTSAITSISLVPVYGSVFMEYSSFALYGVK